ncbi:MAG: hypothetical protein K2J73_01635, partial [Oscillospiraceae bacterium]|nr:hypothetical protein [Oscillospiraceae bacterium]
MKNNPKIALLISAVMAVTLFASCGGDSGSGEAETTSIVREIEVSETSASLTDDFFSDDYDPFADDYDPYGGNGASAAKHNPETGAVSGSDTDSADSYDAYQTEKPK